ncbi:hypothetical protein A2363_02185 [Candidatus Gottesmanbacteria bacterium RIFOXYB1_FULL_47_11]|uniref:Uncharacterized protein n=1 Tax=Candidatus Gottesmanbacteria bacterium RIFOXYB1_FULL_47_11 TaxID=1798401 RepID=A0A1F6BEB1_9BACT|nr:MAG: hypothetical protein A2363_02185 [Candidatus Gottesmanbacteria bacterium RIFOXYB1_FULL_47_11]
MNNLIETAGKNIIQFGQYDVAKTPILRGSMEMARHKKEMVLRTFAQYHMTIKHLFTLTPQELDVIQQVNEKLQKKRGAHEFIEHMKPHRNEILKIVRHAGDVYLPENRKGIEQLATMMGNAWNLRKEDPNWTPRDGDPRADKVIWGFVKGAEDPKINIDFAVCHGIERITTAYLHRIGVTEYIDHKDWLITAMEDVVALRGLQGKYPEANILHIWQQPRPVGLGWVSQARAQEYRKFIR